MKPKAAQAASSTATTAKSRNGLGLLRHVGRDRKSAAAWGSLAHVLKLKTLKVRPGLVVMRMPWSRPASQMAGLLHGGALTTLADTAAAVGVLRLLPEGSATVTSELKINFISNITKGAALAEARLLHRGRLTMVWEIKIRDEQTKKLLAAASGTFFVFHPKIGS